MLAAAAFAVISLRGLRTISPGDMGDAVGIGAILNPALDMLHHVVFHMVAGTVAAAVIYFVSHIVAKTFEQA
ncbi:hypothetical protein GCM10009099_04250 [Caenispirillum bisanense]